MSLQVFSSPYFAKLDVYQLKSINGRRVVMPHYPSYQQTTEYTCGPAAALTLLYWHGNKDYDELSLAKEMKTRPYPYGTNVKDMVRFFEKIGWTVESSLKADKLSRYDDRCMLLEPLTLDELRALMECAHNVNTTID